MTKKYLLYLKHVGTVWLPHAFYVEEMLEKYCDELLPYYEWRLVDEFKQCPLYAATETVERELEKCPDRRTNKNQVEPLLEVYSVQNVPSCNILFLIYMSPTQVSKSIFYELRRRENVVATVIYHNILNLFLFFLFSLMCHSLFSLGIYQALKIAVVTPQKVSPLKRGCQQISPLGNTKKHKESTRRALGKEFA